MKSEKSYYSNLLYISFYDATVRIVEYIHAAFSNNDDQSTKLTVLYSS